MGLSIQSFMPSEEECAEVLIEVRWASGLICVYCGSRSVVKRSWRKSFYNGTGVRIVSDGSTIRLETVIAHSKLPLGFFTTFMMQFKVSIHELAKTLHRPYVTVFRIVRRLGRTCT